MTAVLLQACLNGSRSGHDHPAVPLTPAQTAVDAAGAVAAGAGALHIHPRDPDGSETLAPDAVAAALDATRSAVEVPVGVTTGAWLAPSAAARLSMIDRWSVVPDFASVNFHEEGAPELAAELLARGVGVEAGVWTPAAALALVQSGLAEQCVRVLIEPPEQTLDAAMATVAAIDDVLAAVPGLRRLLHGIDQTAWPVLEAAVTRGDDVRIGLEDTTVLPDGTPCTGNAELVGYAHLALGRS